MAESSGEEEAERGRQARWEGGKEVRHSETQGTNVHEELTRRKCREKHGKKKKKPALILVDPAPTPSSNILFTGDD